MTFWRLVRRRFAPTPAAAFSGAGAAERGGRWNSRGVFVAYASASEALALLEYLVNVDLALLPEDLSFFTAIVDDRDVVDVGALPAGWDASPPGPVSKAIGDAFVSERAHLALRVPSIVIPFARNVLLNPRHERFASVTFGRPIDYDVDSRLATRGRPPDF